MMNHDIEPNFKSFKKRFAQRKKRKPAVLEKVFKSDLDTPVSAYLKLCQNRST